MNRAYYLYCRAAAIAFVINTVYPVILKLFQERLAEDWLHSFLHLGSAALAAYAVWYASSIVSAKLFTWGIGLLYLALGLYGWFTPGLFLDTPFAIPLGLVDNVFHLILSVPALTIIGMDMFASREQAYRRFMSMRRSFPAMKRVAWPFRASSLMVIGLGLLAIPTQFEGPILVPMNAGHTLSALDSTALVPLLLGMVRLYGSLWQRSRQL